MEHASRTCCNADDTTKINLKMGVAKHKSDISEQCFALTSKMLCSVCDGDIGVGLKKGICENLCDTWFNACKDEYLDPYINAHNNLPFCQRDSLVCSKLTQTYETPKQFCEELGFKLTDKDKQDDQLPCYDGKPSSLSKGQASAPKPKPSSKVDPDENWEQQLMRYLDKNPFMVRVIQAIELIVVFGGIYLLYINIKYCCCKKSKVKRFSIADKKHIQELQQKRAQKMRENKKGK